MPSETFDTAFAEYASSAGLAQAGVDLAALKAFILRTTLPKACVSERLKGLRNELASIEHERWSHWQRYQHGKCRLDDDEPGALIIPAALVSQWERQAAAQFYELTEKERESDREQVDRYLPLLDRRLSA